MSKTSVESNFLHSFDIFSNFRVNSVGNELLEFSFLVVLLSVEHPIGDVVLSGVSHNSDKFVNFVVREFSSSSIHLIIFKNIVPFFHVDSSFFADHVGKSSTNTLNSSHGVHDLLFSFDVSVCNTQNVLKFIGTKNHSLNCIN